MFKANLRDVAGALRDRRIVPFFQPIVELRTGNLRGFEVLARWLHPEHGAILPSNFIALAEEHGLIGELSDQMFQQVFAAHAELPAPLTVAVNLSPVQLSSPGLSAGIRRMAEEAGFPLNRLVLEITETALVEDLPGAQEMAQELKAMGCQLALDDFGTGYSSLRHLQALPFAELKIDRSFVSDMTRKRGSRKIVAAIIGLGQSLGLATVAEGVETGEQAQMLLWLGCELGQGWMYGRPAPAEALPAMVAAEPVAAAPGMTSPGEDWASTNLEALPNLRLAQLQAIYDGAPVGLCFLDNNLRYVNLNRRLAEMNGFPVEAHLGRSVEEMFPDWYPIYAPYLERALKGEAISGVEFNRPSKNSRHRSVLLQASYQPAWDESDEVIGVSISLLDITENKHAGAKQRLGAELEESDPEINPEVPWVMDAEGNNLQVSSRWVATTPLGKDRTRNLLWLEALHPDDLEATVRVMKEALRTGKPIDIEYRVADLEGGWRWMRSRGSPRFGSSGEITRWYGSVEDIHDRKMGVLVEAVR
jgi:PAS domain S-box-containing protein